MTNVLGKHLRKVYQQADENDSHHLTLAGQNKPSTTKLGVDYWQCI